MTKALLLCSVCTGFDTIIEISPISNFGCRGSSSAMQLLNMTENKIAPLPFLSAFFHLIGNVLGIITETNQFANTPPLTNQFSLNEASFIYG